MRFRVGDRIKLSESVAKYCGGPFYEAPPGTTGTIMETIHYPCYGVRLDDGKTMLGGYHEHELLPLSPESQEDEEGMQGFRRACPEFWLNRIEEDVFE